MRKLATYVMVLSILLVIAAASGVTPGTGCSSVCADTTAVGPNVVVLTALEADSLLYMIDTMELDMALLEADLLECRAQIPGPEHWVLGVGKYPMVWFVVGAVLGVYATR